MTRFYSAIVLAIGICLMACAGAPTIPLSTTTSPAALSATPPTRTEVSPTGELPLERTIATSASTAASPSSEPTAKPSSAQTFSPSGASRTPVATPFPVTEPTILARIALLTLPGEGRQPVALAQLGDALYVANHDSDNIAVIRDRHVRAFIPTARGPFTLVSDPTRGRIYAATNISPTLLVVQNDAVIQTQVLTSSIQALALVGNDLFTGRGDSATVEVRDAESLAVKSVIKLSQGFDVNALQVDITRRRLFAGVYSRVILIDLDTLREISSIEVPYVYGNFAVSPLDGTLWAGTYEERESRGYIAQFDPAGKRLKRVPLGSDIRQIAFDSAGRVYVVNSFLNQLVVVNAASGIVVAQFPVGSSPVALLLDRDNKRLYTANQDSDNLSVIDLEKLAPSGVIPVAMNLRALLADEARGRVYVASGSTDSVYVVENGAIIREIAVGRTPVDLARDPKTNRLFVASTADGALTVIDETLLTVQSTHAITRALSTVAVDASNGRLFAGSVVLDLNTLEPQSTYYATGFTIGSQEPASFVRLMNDKLYAVAYNGIPGSNARNILYAFGLANLANSKALPSSGGNVTAFTLDPVARRVYAASTHPLAYTHALDVYDAQDNRIGQLALSSRTSGAAVNTNTNHLFLAHSHTYAPFPGRVPPRDNAVQILDTRTLGEVGWIDVPGAPGPMALLRNTVYVAGLDDGALTLIGDIQTAQPPAPTATFTPSPYPSLTPTLPLPTTSLVCTSDPPDPFRAIWNGGVALRLRCPIGQPESGLFAYQEFEGGAMFDDLSDVNAKKIYVLFANRTYRTFDDTWNEQLPSDSCPPIQPNPGLVKPQRGFGKVWCEQSVVQGRLLGARGAEQAITLSMQRFERGMIWSNAPGGPLALFSDGTWE